MKITFDNTTTNQNVDRAAATTTYRDTHAERTNKTGAFALDISGTVMDNTAYKGHGKTTEDVMQEAGQIDVATQRDYMTVMSNTMSEEDFNRMAQDGYQIGDMDVEEVVTIVDRIKAELMKSGTQVVGYTDQIDAETLKEITGSEVFARQLQEQFAKHDIPLTKENAKDAKEAYEKASKLQDITEGAAKYMVENHMEPTIDNLYLAGYSSTADGDRQGRGYYADSVGYYAKKAEVYDWSKLRPQMERVVQEAGLEVNEETMEDARWLVEKGIPLTPEAMSDLYNLDTLSIPMEDEQIISAIASAIADGRRAGEANLSDSRSSMEKAAEYVERFAQITGEAVDQTVAEGKDLTLVNLEAAGKEVQPLGNEDAGGRNSAGQGKVNSQESQQYVYTSVTGGQPEDVRTVSGEEVKGIAENNAEHSPVTEVPANITARRQLEEIRLMMTVEANRKLLESGYAIDTTELEQLVDTLKRMEAGQRQLIFGETDVDRAAQRASLYVETRSKVADIPHMPIEISGRFKVTDEDFTLNQVHVDGSALRSRYDEARERYEAWMTDTRDDLGDSLGKAFQNVDDILESMGLRTSEENRRAVRILGYNRMEVSLENIEAVRESDMELRRVIDKMTPAAVLQTIRDGKNPLEMTIPELNDYLDSIPYGKEQENEKYSKFLYKLDKNKAIGEDERTAYIGIYRMLRQFEKTDDAAVGALFHMGAELSFKNLLSAVRSHRRAGMDFLVDDAFAGVEAIKEGRSITGQIESGFKKTARDIMGRIIDRMAKQDASTQKDYQEDQLRDCRQACEAEDQVVEELLNNKQPVTINNLAAAQMLMNSRGLLYKKLNEYTTPANREKVKDALSHLQDAMTDKDSALEAYDKMQQVYEEALEEAQYEPGIHYIDLKAIQSCRKQLALAGNLAKEENYQIPVEINGETTAIHLRVLHNQENGGKVKMTLDTQSYGKVAADFRIRDNKMSGFIACSTPEGVEALKGCSDRVLKNLRSAVGSLGDSKLKLGGIGVVHSSSLDLNSFMSEEAQDSPSTVQTADLYQIAKAFITAVTI